MGNRMMRIAAAVVLAAISTAANHNKVVLLGLPKSGSYRIHQFIQCMNQNQKVHDNIPENDASSSSQQQQHPVTTTVLSSAHYCCDPHRSDNNSHRHDDDENEDEASFFFPCPAHMIPCGTCMHDYYNMNHDSNATTTTTSWMEHCGNYNVYANFHLEATTGDGDYTFFLPQHFALAHLVGDESHPDDVDEMNTNSTTTTTTTWIYHHRATAAQWATHVAHWYSITHRLLHAFGVPYYYYENHEPDEVARTLDDFQHELDTTSMERLHNQTDQQRRTIELVAIHDHFQNTIQQFVHDYNSHRHDDEDDPPRNHHQIQLFDINIDNDDDDDDTPGTLARALGYTNMAAARSCWSTTDAPNETDYQDFQLATTFRASV